MRGVNNLAETNSAITKAGDGSAISPLLDDNYCIYGNNRTAPNPHLTRVRRRRGMHDTCMIVFSSR